MRIININNKYDFIKKNSLFKKKGGESLLQKLLIQLLPQLVCAGRGVQCRRGGVGGAVLSALAAAVAAAYRKFQ